MSYHMTADHPNPLRGLRATLMGLVLLAILPALGLALYHGLTLRAHARDEAKAEASHSAQSLAARHKEHYDAVRRLVETLAATTVVRVIDPKGCSQLFSQLKVQSGAGLANILAVSATGEPIGQAAPDAGDFSPPDHTPMGKATYAARDWFKSVTESKTCVSEPFSLAPDGQPVMTVACPSLGWDGEVKAVVAASMNLEALAQSAAALSPTNSVVGVLSPEGSLLALLPDATVSLGTNIAASRLGRTVLEKQRGSAETTGLSGLPKLVGFDRLLSGFANSPTVFVEIPLDEAYAASTRLLHEQALWLALVGVIGLGVAWMLGSKLLVRPIIAMVNAAEAIGRGEFTVRFGQPGHALELERLGRAFNTMAKGLEERQSELEKKTEELKNSNKDLEQFAYVASHDLQEPLRKITSFADLLTKRCSGQLDANGQRYMDYMVDGARRMSQLITHLLEYSRIDTCGNTFDSVDLNVSLDAALDNLQFPIEENNATIVRKPLPLVTADATQICQLFQNLIGNAIKYRGTAVPIILVAAVYLDGAWVVSVADNGPGIAPQHHERIFRMFQRLHADRGQQGAGIGLSFCKRIAERHGGRIWVESEEGRGSTFYFTLPDAEAEEGPA
uniref:histidine kinase n=1 Tax=Desulfovibrio sp. U5L TaxID=596152 RepID=I2PX49_9BACT